MKRIMVKSVFDAFEYVMQHYYPAGLKEIVEKSDTYAVISIQDSHTNGFGISFTENQYCKGVLTLQFDDITYEVEGAVLFSDEMAVQIIQFIKDHMDVDTLLIHCYAGQSRSKAVGAFAMKMLGGDNSEYFKKYNLNQHVYDTLLAKWNVWDGEYETEELLLSMLRRNPSRNVSYTGNEFVEVGKKIEEFCNRVPAPGMSMGYLNKVCELSDLYGEMLCISEEEKTFENKLRIAELAAEIIEIVG